MVLSTLNIPETLEGRYYHHPSHKGGNWLKKVIGFAQGHSAGEKKKEAIKLDQNPSLLIPKLMPFLSKHP